MNVITCEDFKKFIDPYLDDEFEATERATFDAHLATCAECRSHYEQRASFLGAVRPALQRPTHMPSDMQARLNRRMRSASRPARMKRVAKRLALPVPAIAIAGMVFVMTTPLAGFVPPVVGEAVEQHVERAPVEVPTPEAQEVDAWFQGKVPFEMHAPRFDERKAVLLGGRLSRVGGRTDGFSRRRAAYLMYGVGAHKMSVLVFNGRELALEGDALTIAGQHVRIHDAGDYRVAVYERDGLGYAVTSDLPEGEMLQLIGSSF